MARTHEETQVEDAGGAEEGAGRRVLLTKEPGGETDDHRPVDEHLIHPLRLAGGGEGQRLQSQRRTPDTDSDVYIVNWEVGY